MLNVLEVAQHDSVTKDLQQACVASALPYRTVARWVRAFKEEHENVSNMPWSGHPPVSDEDVHIVSALMKMDQNFTIRELAQKTGLAPSTVLHILKDQLRMRKIVPRWVPHDRKVPIRRH